ncbi:MAG TPA: glycosyltransferase 87 family protein [Candidatus Sulfotelmatobacter sp.]|jgi:hypothetical protein
MAKADPDFTAFYTAGWLLREGRGDQLYDARAQLEVQQRFAGDSDIRRGPLPYIHPPYEAALFLPLTFLTYREALAVWEMSKIGMLLAVALLLRGALSSLRAMPLWEWMLAFLAFFPVFADFLQGQDAIFLLLLFVLSFRAFAFNSEFAAGCWLGLGVFRFHLVIPLVLILALWNYRKLVAGFAVAGSAALLLSLALVGWRGALQYPFYLWHWASSTGIGNMPPRLMPNLVGLLTGWPLPQAAKWTLQVAALAASVAVLAEAVHLRTLTGLQNLENDRSLLNLRLAYAVIAAVLVGYNAGSYDLCLLILPLAWVADYCFALLPELPAIGRRLLLPCLALLISPLWFLLWRRWERINLMAIFLLWWIYALRRETLRRAGTAAAGT